MQTVMRKPFFYPLYVNVYFPNIVKKINYKKMDKTLDFIVWKW